jgi:Tol biopolymer transport system component
VVALLYVLFIAASPKSAAPAGSLGAPSPAIARDLAVYPHKILFESRRDGNGEIYVMNAGGSNLVNLTRTPDVDECYPKASPDGRMISFGADEGGGPNRRRNLYVMNADGTGRRKIADNGREPCWSADGTKLAYVKGEFEDYSQVDYKTTGLFVHDLVTGGTQAHPNKELKHLYTLNWTADGNWFIATVHGAMGFKQNLIAIEAKGTRVVDLGIDCCRPDVSADGSKIAWGRNDFTLVAGDLVMSAHGPAVTNVRPIVESGGEIETYHVDWSPDGKYVLFSYGPKTHRRDLKELLPEFPGVEAREWNIGVADASAKNVWTPLTRDGRSNKEPDWLPEPRK